MSKRHKKKITTDWYRLDNILQHPASYYMVIGERSNGKTHAVKERIIINYAQTGMKFVYIRRRNRQKVIKRCRKVFVDIDEMAKNLLGSVIDYDINHQFYITNENGEKITIGYALSIEDGIDDKGGSFADCNIILFDEFLERSYLDDEVTLFLNMISTIVRKRKDFEIFMLGNTISKYCPYFEKWGIDISKTRPGCISTFVHSRGVSISLERTKTMVQKGETIDTKKDKYLGFDNDDTVSMMLYGEWESIPVETKIIDGLTWASPNRKLLQFYYYGLGKVFECSAASYKGLPICFVRSINTQNFMINEHIQCVFTLDRVQFTNKNGFVPSMKTYSKYLSQSLLEQINILKDCMATDRVIYNNVENGTEFIELFDKI